MTAHTPGPWWVDDRRRVHPNLGPNGEGLQVTAAHRGPGSSYCVARINFWDAADANARLIAAAPDLLEALRRNRAALDLIDPARPLQYAATMDLMRRDMDAAIAKATGTA